MVELFKNWLDARRRKAEREAFARGYEWGKHALLAGTYTVDALEAFALGTFNRHPNEYAFDRGVHAAVSEAKHARA